MESRLKSGRTLASLSYALRSTTTTIPTESGDSNTRTLINSNTQTTQNTQNTQNTQTPHLRKAGQATIAYFRPSMPQIIMSATATSYIPTLLRTDERLQAAQQWSFSTQTRRHTKGGLVVQVEALCFSPTKSSPKHDPTRSSTPYRAQVFLVSAISLELDRPWLISIA